MNGSSTSNVWTAQFSATCLTCPVGYYVFVCWDEFPLLITWNKFFHFGKLGGCCRASRFSTWLSYFVFHLVLWWLNIKHYPECWMFLTWFIEWRPNWSTRYLQSEDQTEDQTGQWNWSTRYLQSRLMVALLSVKGVGTKAQYAYSILFCTFSNWWPYHTSYVKLSWGVYVHTHLFHNVL
jgi:hypothetical protein